MIPGPDVLAPGTPDASIHKPKVAGRPGGAGNTPGLGQPPDRVPGQGLIENAAAATELQKKGLAIEDAQRLHYLECTDATEVRLNLDTVAELATIIKNRREAIVSLAAREVNPPDSLEEIVKQIADKWEKWGAVAAAVKEGKTVAMPAEKLTRADLDIAYYTLFDEILVRGTFLGQEMRDARPRKILGLIPVGEVRTMVEPTSPSALRQMGLTDDYSREIYGLNQDPRLIEKKLLEFEGTRRRLLKSMTGHDFPGDLSDRLNWGTTIESLLNPNQAGLRLHDEIRAQLEGSTVYRSVLERYRDRNGNLRTTADLLVNIDNPQDRLIALKAYHEAMMAAANHRFQARGEEFCDANFGERQSAWVKGHYIENARANRKSMEGTGQLTTEQRQALERLQTGLVEVRDLFHGRLAEGGKPEAVGLPARLEPLLTAIGEYRDFAAIPENSIAQINIQIGNEEQIIQSINEFQEGAGSPPPQVAMLEQQLLTVTIDRNALLGLGLAADILAPTLQAYDQQISVLRGQQTQLLNQLIQRRESNIAALRARIPIINTERANLARAIGQTRSFIETEMPQSLASINQTIARLSDIVANPGNYPYLTAAQVVTITNHRDNLQKARDFLQNDIIGILRKQPPETNDAYANRADIQAFQLNTTNYDTHLSNLQTDANVYTEILRGVRDEGTRARMDGVDLVITIAAGGLEADTKINRQGIAEAQFPNAIDRLFNEDSNILTELANTKNLDLIRALLCDYAAIKNDPRIGNSDLWKRVYSDEYIIQQAIERFRDIEIPDGAVDLTQANDRTRSNVFSRIASNKSDLGKFLVHLVKARVYDAAGLYQTQTNIREARSTSGAVTYVVENNQLGRARGIFSAEANDEFINRMRAKRLVSYRVASNELDVDNVGQVDRTSNLHVTTPSGRRVDVFNNFKIQAPESDPLALTIGGQKRELPIRLELFDTPLGRSFKVHLQANPSLAGVNIPAIGGNYDRRWVDLLQLPGGGDRLYTDFTDLVNSLAGLMPGLTITAKAELGKFILRSMGDYFLGLSPQRRRGEFPAFPDMHIPAAGYPGVTGLGYDRISMDATGNIELLRNDGTRISVDTALSSRGPNPPRLDSAQADELFRFIGTHVFNRI